MRSDRLASVYFVPLCSRTRAPCSAPSGGGAADGGQCQPDAASLSFCNFRPRQSARDCNICFPAAASDIDLFMPACVSVNSACAPRGASLGGGAADARNANQVPRSYLLTIAGSARARDCNVCFPAGVCVNTTVGVRLRLVPSRVVPAHVFSLEVPLAHRS